ncbi:hypothetical protein [Novipirellula artificiosorum]|uniref:Uncharacterized protein n=1 Tax=Novipirellula artificiosorum TaxID=2528016 RepID=A0A5C6D2W8_9BACT|nr:hypothetical protein [Novipirellula artificiosorum]TWU31180.1 hypothetical protein Poly41_63710 [Novipirellula artificiosorum]
MTLAIDDAEPRKFRTYGLIGFNDWTSPRYAYTKMFAHYGEQFGHWSWYRVADVQLKAGSSRLTLGAKQGASIDAAMLLPVDAAVDRSAMNLLQNWNYGPWYDSLDR